MILQARVQKAVDAVCRNHGVSFGALSDRNTWSIEFAPEATQQERDAGTAAMLAVTDSAPPDELEQAALSALNGGASQIDIVRLLKAKFVSDLAHRLGKAPGALTGTELAAERNRIAAIYKAL